MKKLLFISIFLVWGYSMTIAQTINESTARSRAEAFFASKAAKAPNRAPAKQESLTLVYTSQGNGNTRFYVYNRGENNGYVIMGGDEQAKEILAYVPQGHFVYDRLPDNMKWWLSQYENEIDTAIIVATYAPKRTMQKVPSRSSVANPRQDIPDLITTKWNQGEPFNSMIPTTPSGEQFPSGCVPTALAQIMKYWNYPQVGSGSNSYVMSGNEGDITFSADFSNTTYDWTNMLDTYEEGQYTQQEAQAVGTLMYHIGVALGVMYDIEGTGYWDINSGDFEYDHHMVKILKDNFHYNSKMRRVNRDTDTWKDEDWEDLIYSELLAGRPVYYSASKSVGHAFICHGYSNNLDMFSFNWGWGSLNDGYFSLSGTNALNGYNIAQSIIVGLCPDSIILSTPLVGDTITVDNKNYIIRNTITKRVGKCQDYVHQNQPEYTVPSQISYQEELYDVTYLEMYAFSNASEVHSTSLPSTIEMVAPLAFHHCGIDSITIPPKVKKIQMCFDDCWYLQKINMDSVEEIGVSCFRNCYALREVVIPEKVTALYELTFENCKSLTTITLPANFKTLSPNNVFIGVPLTKMFCYCDVPDSGIGNDPFIGNASIEDGVLYVPSQYIDHYQSSPFWNRWGHILPIEEVQSDTDQVGDFITQNGLTYLLGYKTATLINIGEVISDTITIPSEVISNADTFAVTTITSRVVDANTPTSKPIEIQEGIINIEEGAFFGCGATSITLPQSLKRIEMGAFEGMRNLKSIHIPGGLEYLGPMTVGGCANLEDIVLEEGIVEISDRCFADLQSLKTIILPRSLKYINYGTFRQCRSLKEMYILSPQILSRYFDLHQFSYISGKPEDFDENQIDGTLYLSANFTPDQIDRYTNLLPWSLWGNVRLIQNISAISLPEDTICISKNIKGCLYPQLVPAGVSINKFVYSSTDESIVRINEMGEYTAIGNGEADIIISSYVQKDINKKCHVIVNGARPVIPDSTSCLLYEPFEYDSSTNQIILRHNWNSAMGHIVGNLWSHTDNPDLFGLTDYNLISDTLSFAGGDLYLSILTDNPLKIVIGEKSQTILPSKEQTSYLISDASKRVVYIFKNVPANPVLKIRVFSTANIKELKVWDPTTISYPINFVNDDGTILWSDTILYGETPIYYGELPNKPSSAQYIYSFAGWSPNIEVVTGNATYTAVYDSIVRSYLVTFTDEIGNILQQTWVEYGQLPIYNGATPTKSATAQYTYIFKGWDKEIVAVETTTTYTAKFDTIINQFTISVFAENGSVTGAGTYDYGTEVTLTATPNEGYEFDNWSNGITDNPYTFIVEQDVELTANFIKKVCTSWQDINSEIKVIKYFENERLIIERNGIKYTATGQKVR